MSESYLTISEIAVPLEGAEALRRAFKHRLHAVDGFPGFLGLEVLRDRRRPGRFLMMTRWASRECFRSYMRSQEHRASHERIPGGETRPRAAGFSDYDVISR